MSSLGLITRSSVPALTSVLAGSSLILLNRWMNGNWEDKWEILPFINVFYLEAPHPLPYPGVVLLLLVVSAIAAVCSVWFELMRFEVSLMTVHMGWGFIHGFKWFLFSEGALFFGFFWTYFHFAWSVDYKTGGFPNFHIVTVDPFCVPLTNTVVLISSGFTLTYANHALIVGCHEECLQAMTYTVALGGFFSYQQWWEYNCCRFTICQGSFASIFYMATGFHGAHVQIGTAFVLYNMYRVSEGEFHRGRWVGWRMGLWYWHFVDIIWIALYLTIYVWNSLIFTSLCCLLMCYALAAYRNLGNYLWLSALTTLHLFIGAPGLLLLSLTAYLLAHQVNLTTSAVVVALSKLFLAAILSATVGSAILFVFLLGGAQFTLTLDVALMYLTLGGLYIGFCCNFLFFFVLLVLGLYVFKLPSLCAYSLIMGVPLSLLFLLKLNLIYSFAVSVLMLLLLPMSTWGSKFLLMEASFRGGRGLVFIIGGLLLGRDYSLLIFLICVSFLVLLERFFLGLSQNRPGPRVVGLYGLLQTLVDGGKLFTKTATLSLPLLPAGLFFTLGLCSVSYATTYEAGWLPTLLCISVLSLAVLVASRSNGSTWGLVAANRVMLMALSFDVVFSFFLISLLYVSRFDSLVATFCLLTICLMELGRTPYDLVEGESELVSGYNVEYGGFGFVLLFLGEYLGFYWIAGITCFLIGLPFIFVVVLHLGLIMIRAVLPRYKMNHVLRFSWGVLNLVCFSLFLLSVVYFFFFSYFFFEGKLPCVRCVIWITLVFSSSSNFNVCFLVHGR